MARLIKFKFACLTASIILGLTMNTSAWTGNIVFEDNFDGYQLDNNKWEIQEACDNRYGGNNLHCYVRDNVQVLGGNLVITAKKQLYQDKQYTSGRIRQRAGFSYGAYVTRARFLRGDHLHPAIWLFNAHHCRYEEIDIAEYRGQASEARVQVCAAHFGRDWENITSTRDELSRFDTGIDLSEGFHEYAVLWTPSKIAWYFDNRLLTMTSLTDGYWMRNPNKIPCDGIDKAFVGPLNFIFNVAVGGGFFQGFPPFDPSTWQKTTLEVDWVRIYQE